nr:hypothetical transcript [Hymenolepis microstoma]
MLAYLFWKEEFRRNYWLIGQFVVIFLSINDVLVSMALGCSEPNAQKDHQVFAHHYTRTVYLFIASFVVDTFLHFGRYLYVLWTQANDFLAPKPICKV